MGRLDSATVAACEATLASSPKITDKDAISRVIMANAIGHGDTRGWERLVRRHLNEIGQSDPDLLLPYARALSKQGVSRSREVIKWSNLAMERSSIWTGDAYLSRVGQLHSLRTHAAMDLWSAAVERRVADPEKEAEEDGYRQTARQFAKEWYDFALASGQSPITAQALCASAAGTADYCK